MAKMKLQWKICVYLLGFCALLLAILWLFQTVFLSDVYKLVRKAEIEQAIKLVERNINSPRLEEVLLELELTKEIIVMPAQDFAPPVRPIIDLFGRRQPESITKTQEFLLGNGVRIALTFYALVTPVEATVSTLRLQLLVITGIMVLLATLLAIIISRRIAHPIAQLNQSAKVLAKGNYATEFHGSGFLEIKELSDTLNTAASELSQVDRMRRELMANVSHDLRTPLAFIYSYAEMMHDFPLEVTPEQSQVIMDETKRLTTLVNDMLDISSLEAGKVKLKKAEYNLTASLRKTIARLGEYRCQLVFAPEVELYVCADEIKITQAFYNLLLNAVTHSEGKPVAVRQIVHGESVRIEVQDQGHGIEAADLPYIWERYYQVDKKHQRPTMGTGLGLAIAKQIIELHEGEYGVESAVGQGSLFWFEIPGVWKVSC